MNQDRDGHAHKEWGDKEGFPLEILVGMGLEVEQQTPSDNHTASR